MPIQKNKIVKSFEQNKAENFKYKEAYKMRVQNYSYDGSVLDQSSLSHENLSGSREELSIVNFEYMDALESNQTQQFRDRLDATNVNSVFRSKDTDTLPQEFNPFDNEEVHEKELSAHAHTIICFHELALNQDDEEEYPPTLKSYDEILINGVPLSEIMETKSVQQIIAENKKVTEEKMLSKEWGDYSEKRLKKRSQSQGKNYNVDAKNAKTNNNFKPWQNNNNMQLSA